MKLCSIASGSSGNCIFAGSETTSLLIDAGISGKRVEAGLAVLDRSAKELDGILVTHEHSDHIQGLGVLARRYGIPIYATDGTIQAMQQTKSLLQVPTIDVQRIIQLPLDDIPGLVQAEIVFNGANIDKANIVVAVGRGKSPAAAP